MSMRCNDAFSWGVAGKSSTCTQLPTNHQKEHKFKLRTGVTRPLGTCKLLIEKLHLIRNNNNTINSRII